MHYKMDKYYVKKILQLNKVIQISAKFRSQSFVGNNDLSS